MREDPNQGKQTSSQQTKKEDDRKRSIHKGKSVNLLNVNKASQSQLTRINWVNRDMENSKITGLNA